MKHGLLALLALTLLVACRTPTAGPGATRALASDDPVVRGLLRGLDERAKQRRSLRAFARFVVDAQDFSFRGSQRVAARRPSSLRVELLGLFSQVAGMLVTDGAQYQFFDAGSGEFERGRVVPHLLWEVARVDLSPPEAVGLLLGAVAPESHLRPGEAFALADGGVRVRLDDRAGRRRQGFEFDTLGRLRVAIKWGHPDVELWEVRYEDFRPAEGVQGSDFAYDVDLRFAQRRTEAKFRFQDVEVNSELPDELFHLRPADRVSSRAGGIIR